MTPAPQALVHAARSPGVKASHVQVLVELHEWLNDSQFLPVKPWCIADRLHISQSHVYRALDALVVHGYLVKGDRLGTAVTYRLTVPNASAA